MLARGVADLPAEVLLSHDVGGVLRPALGELHALLLEGDAIAMADARVARLPLHSIERMLIRRGEQAPEVKP